MSNERDTQLAQIASWYYEHGEGLSSIAKRIGRSVSMASRMLQEARDRQLVEIRINYPIVRANELEERIRARYGLSRVHVFSEPEAVDPKDRMGRFGSLGARVVEEAFEGANNIGVSWGSQVYSIVQAIGQLSEKGDRRIIQTSGALGATEMEFDGARICQRLADRMNATPLLLHAPLIVDTPHVADVLRSSPTISHVLELARRADAILVSVGSPYSERSGLRRARHLTDVDVEQLKGTGAVGDIMGFHLDARGTVIDNELNQRVIGLRPDALHKIPNVIVAAFGTHKAPAIRASLEAGYVDTLITDKTTASTVLKD